MLRTVHPDELPVKGLKSCRWERMKCTLLTGLVAPVILFQLFFVQGHLLVRR
jgi:hypothetical protein